VSFEVASDRDDRGPKVRRWVPCAAIVLAAHALAIALLAPKSEEIDADAGSPIALIELAPLPVAPAAPPSDLAPGPLQSESVAEDAPTPVDQPPPPPPPEQVPISEALSSDPAPVETKPVEAAPEPPPSNVAIATAPPNAPDIGVVAAGPDLGRVAKPSPARVERWERSLIARVERFKRYPPQAEGRFGIASIAFSIDRNGHLLSARIIKGSGSAILDEEALAMIRRAVPLPAPPADVADDRLSFVLPVRYAPTGR
jgi:protein TonB